MTGKGIPAARNNIRIKFLRTLHFRAHPSQAYQMVGHLQKTHLFDIAFSRCLLTSICAIICKCPLNTINKYNFKNFDLNTTTIMSKSLCFLVPTLDSTLCGSAHQHLINCSFNSGVQSVVSKYLLIALLLFIEPLLRAKIFVISILMPIL